MRERDKALFDPAVFLSKASLGRKIVDVKANGTFCTQGSPATRSSIFRLGGAKLTVVSREGKEATIAIVTQVIFWRGIDCIGAGTAPNNCDRMHEEHAFSDLFLKFLLTRSMRTQADLVDQLFNNSEKRLARILLLKPSRVDIQLPASVYGER